MDCPCDLELLLMNSFIIIFPSMQKIAKILKVIIV